MKIFARDSIARYTRVFHNGKEITNDYTYADDIEQRALVLVRDEAGRVMVETGRPVVNELKGGIEIRLKDDAPEGMVKYFANIMAEEQMRERAAVDPGIAGAG